MIPRAALAAVAVLAVNDHVLKRAWPGVVTGKLSDVAGMVFFPLLLHTLAWSFVPQRQRSVESSRMLLMVACAATALVFALVKTLPLANEAYRWTWGAMQWPFHAFASLARGLPLPALRRVVLVRDVTDILAVPFVFLAYRIGRLAGTQVPARA